LKFRFLIDNNNIKENKMDETIKFFIGVTLFLAVIMFEWVKEKSNKRAS
jgi:hypothetical protein